MKKGGYITQQRIREENRNKILSLLNKESQRFSSLEELTGYSPAGLTMILYELLDKKKIIKIVKDNKLFYSIKKGIRLGEILFLGRVLYEIKERGREVSIEVNNSRTASVIGRYHNAVKQFLDTGDRKKLRKFKNKKVKDADGKHHVLETNPTSIIQVNEAIEEPEFYQIYEV